MNRYPGRTPGRLKEISSWNNCAIEDGDAMTKRRQASGGGVKRISPRRSRLSTTYDQSLPSSFPFLPFSSSFLPLIILPFRSSSFLPTRILPFRSLSFLAARYPSFPLLPFFPSFFSSLLPSFPPFLALSTPSALTTRLPTNHIDSLIPTDQSRALLYPSPSFIRFSILFSIF